MTGFYWPEDALLILGLVLAAGAVAGLVRELLRGDPGVFRQGEEEGEDD